MSGKMMELQIEDQSLETLTELAKESFSEVAGVFAVIVANETRLTNFGRILAACRTKLPDGEKWSEWVQQTFGGKLEMRSVRRWISDYKNPEAKEQRNAAKRLQRTPVSAAMVERTPVSAQPSVTVVEPKPDRDNDPNPAPRTNTHHTADNRKAQESQRSAPAPVRAELLDEPDQLPEKSLLCDFTIREIGEYLVESAEDPKARAQWLRKLANELDPPDEDKIPSAAQCIAEIPEDFEPDLRDAAEEWAHYKQSRPRGDKIQNLRAWRIAVKAFRKYPKHVVISKVEKAIASSWKGWDGDTQNGKASKSDELYRNPGPRAPVKYDNVPG
jgi:hypothetical protein